MKLDAPGDVGEYPAAEHNRMSAHCSTAMPGKAIRTCLQA